VAPRLDRPHLRDLVKGLPRPSAEFVDAFEKSGTPVAKVGIGTFDQRKEQAKKQAEQAGKPLRDVEDHSQLEAITLVDATVLWGGRQGGTRIPAIRVSLDAIAAWWLVGGEKVKGDSDMWFGLAIPLG
jgi:hypothetical protein